LCNRRTLCGRGDGRPQGFAPSPGRACVHFATSSRTPALTSPHRRLTLKRDRNDSPMPTPEEDLGQIERDIRRLKIEYEQYFGGGRSRPPTDTQWRLETLMRRYNDRTAELSYGQRFRYNNLAQTYAKYMEMWRKKTQQKESGVAQHHFGAAAKAIEAARAQEAAGREREEPLHRAATAAEASGVRASEAREASADFTLSLVDPELEKGKVVEL